MAGPGITAGARALQKRLKNRRLPSLPAIRTDNSDLNRALESIQEHLRMYEGDRGAPKERFVTLSELEQAGLVKADVKQGLGYISKVLNREVAQEAGSTVNPTLKDPVRRDTTRQARTPGGGGGAGATTSSQQDSTQSQSKLNDLSDLNVAKPRKSEALVYDGGKWTGTNLFTGQNRWTGRQQFDDPLSLLNLATSPSAVPGRGLLYTKDDNDIYYMDAAGVETSLLGGGVSTLGGLTDVTLTTPTTGDVLRYNGTVWVNYPDSNFATSTHTHLLAAGATDVTATAAEVNLLDLAGLTAGWALIADTATTASWQALPAGGPADGTVTDSVLRWSGTDWVEETQVRVTSAGLLRIYDSTLFDRADFSHDGTDFNTTFTNTTDWDIDGLTNFDLMDGTTLRLFAAGSSTAHTFQAVAGNILRCLPVSFFDVGSTTPGQTTKSIRSFFNGSNGAPYYAFNGTSIDDQQWQFCFNFDGNVNNKRHAIRSKHNGSVAADNSIDFLFHDAAGADGDLPSIFSFRIGATATSVRAGTSFAILDSTNVDSASFSHDGTNFNTAFAGTTDWDVTGIAEFHVANYRFDVDQTVGAGQDDYVLTYDDALGTIQLEAAGGGSAAGGSDLYNYTYDSNTSTADPGAGNIRFNNAVPSSANRFMISGTDGDSNNLNALLDDFWTGHWGVEFRMVKADDPSIYVIGAINSTSDQGVWHNPYINWVETNGTFTNGDAVKVQITNRAYVHKPTTDHGIYTGSAILSGQPLNGVIQSALITHDPSLGTARLTFNDGGPVNIDVNGGNTDITGSAIFQIRASNRFEIYGSSNVLPRLTVSESAVSIGHGNDSGNGAPQFYLRERTSLTNPGAGWGGLAVLSSNPNQLWFIDDLNNTYNLTDPGAGSTAITAGWSTGSGGSLTIGANAPLFYTEQATNDSPGAGQGQVWVRDDAPNTLMFTDDAGTDFEVSGGAVGGTATPAVLADTFAYDTSTLSADPGTGEFRLSAASPASATFLYINDTSQSSIDVGLMLAQVAVGDTFILASPDDPTNYNQWMVSSKADQTGWWRVGINYISGTNSMPAAATVCRFEFSTQPEVKKGDFADNAADVLLWSKTSQDRWEGSGTAFRVNTTSPATGGRLRMGSMTTQNTASPFIRISQGNADNTIIFADRGTDAQGFYQRCELNSTFQYQFGYRVSSVDTDIFAINSIDELLVLSGGTLKLQERGSARANLAGAGEIWVNSADAHLYFTDDAGVDYDLVDAGATATTISSGWSTGSGGSITIAANAPLFYTEQAADDSPAAGEGQVWLRNSAPNVLMFTNDDLDDLQLSPYVQTLQTTDATQTEIFALAVPSGSSIVFEALIIGREDATGDTCAEKIVGLISNEAGTTALIGTPGVDRHESAGATGWVVTVAADDTGDTLTFDVTGEAAHTVDWRIHMQVIEV